MASREVARACLDCGVALRDDHALDAVPVRCVPCFRRELLSVERGFLDHYAEFGALSHRVIAENAARGLVMGSPGERKILALSIFEEFLKAAGDLVRLFDAIKRRREQPIVESVLAFRLDTASVRAFFGDLERLDDEDLMGWLGLPRPEQISRLYPGWDRDDLKYAATALWRAMHGLRRVTADGTLAEPGLTGALMHHHASNPAVTRSDWTTDFALEPQHIAIVHADVMRRELVVERLSASEPDVNALVVAIDAVSRVTSDLAYAYALLHHPDLDGAVGLRRGA